MDIFLFSGTHWDREWYQDFQGFRFRLVKMMDELIHELETNENLKVFHLDGQTIVLEDYLEIMPQNKERLAALIQSKKLLVGPWYCMPDEFLLSGESLIKNLQKGFALSRSFGAEPLKYGYICDIFGHIAQMPQIFSEMGIDYALLGRGTNEHSTPMHFYWQSPDKSGVITFKLEDSMGYTTFTMQIRAKHLSGEELDKAIKTLTDSEIKRSNIPIVLLMDASDHVFCNTDVKNHIEVLKKLYPTACIHQANVMEMCTLLEGYKEELPIKNGELNEPAKIGMQLITNTLSSRYPIKKYNDVLQTMLEKTVQPLYAFGLVDLPSTYLEMANQFLLQNHPHDSICGCSIDQVHKDMMYRFDQTQLICNQIVDTFINTLSNPADSENMTLKVFNPLPYSQSRVIEVELSFDKDFKTKYQEPFGYQLINSFKIFDKNGNEKEYGICDIKTDQLQRVYSSCNSKRVDLYKIAFEADLIPMGVTEFTICPYEYSSRYLSRMPQSQNSAENEHITLTINGNGSIDITDKKTNNCYKNLLSVIDDGEIGDGWYHVNPACDKVLTNTSCDIEKVRSSAVQTVFKVTQKMQLPKQMIHNKRSDEYVPFHIEHYITLSKGQRWVEVKSKVCNNVLDHRLRLVLPTGIESALYYVNQPFCFLERHTDIDVATQNWHECEVLEKQTGGIVLKKDEDHGFAFISGYGLHECGVKQNGDMNITLFRSFAKTVLTNGEPGGQLLEDMEFSYLLAPFDKETSFAQLQRMQDILQTSLITACGDAVQTHISYLEIENPNILFSTANKTKHGLEIRIYNPEKTKEKTRIRLANPIKNACLVDLDGRVKENLLFEGNELTLELCAYKFATIRVE